MGLYGRPPSLGRTMWTRRDFFARAPRPMQANTLGAIRPLGNAPFALSYVVVGRSDRDIRQAVGRGQNEFIIRSFIANRPLCISVNSPHGWDALWNIRPRGEQRLSDSMFGTTIFHMTSIWVRVKIVYIHLQRSNAYVAWALTACLRSPWWVLSNTLFTLGGRWKAAIVNSRRPGLMETWSVMRAHGTYRLTSVWPRAFHELYMRMQWVFGVVDRSV